MHDASTNKGFVFIRHIAQIGPNSRFKDARIQPVMWIPGPKQRWQAFQQCYESIATHRRLN